MTMQANDTVQVKVDIHQRVTDTILKYMEEGTAPWQKPWKTGGASFAIPKNMVTEKPYNGVNILLLWGAAHKREYSSNLWASYRQWNEQKESIRKGEKGTMVVYYDFMEKEENGEMKKVPFIKSYTVFNKCQLASHKPEEEIEVPVIPLVERLENVEQFMANTNAVIRHEGTRACYIPSIDEIHMPEPALFVDTEHSTATENYYSTLGHELVHWSGSETRLNRNFGKRFGDKTYAAEELVAEFGAAFLCAELGISREPRKDHADYIANWMTALKSNKFIVTSAANAASKSVEYLRGCRPNQ